jgi:hypothetical protein
VVALVCLRLPVDIVEWIAARELDEGRLRIVHDDSVPRVAGPPGGPDGEDRAAQVLVGGKVVAGGRVTAARSIRDHGALLAAVGLRQLVLARAEA